jgi:hypothetical protein
VRHAAVLPPASSPRWLRFSVVNAGGASAGNSSLLVDNIVVTIMRPSPSMATQ